MRMTRWLPAVALMVLLLAACGSTGGDDGVASVTGDSASGESQERTEADREEAGLKFAECMREHGVDMPDPGTGDEGGLTIQASPGDYSPEEFEEADEACRHHLEGAFEDADPERMQEFQDRALEFAQCMRDNGVEDHPDPEFEGGGRMRMTADQDVFNDPDFEEAQKACEELMPQRRIRGGGDS